MSINSLITTHLTPVSISTFLFAVVLCLVISALTIRKAKRTQFDRGASSRCGEIDALILEKSQLRESVDQLSEKNAKLGTDLVQANTHAEQLPILENEVDRLRSSLANARGECIRLSTQISEQQAQNEDKLQILNEAKSQLKDQFKVLANEILDEKSRKFTDQNQSNLTSLLDPVREQLRLFEKKFLEGQNKDIEGRTEIKAEIQQLRKLNEQISLEADSLTKALKGDSKIQGTWGELILEKVFESSELEKGREYDV
ncbi:DNA recombination protein RmuC [Pseudomonadota bacterium]